MKTKTLNVGLAKLNSGHGRGRAVFASALLALSALCMAPAPAKAWWNDDWQLRKKLTIDTSATGANITDPIGTQAVLIRLHVGNFRFGQAKDDGADLRFVASDDKTPLKYHIEKYDSLLGEAFVWVQVPDLKPGQKTDFWLYYGNKKAQAAGDHKATYDADTLLVYHFAERGTPPQDSSVWSNGAQAVGQSADGAIIGNGLRLNGQSPLILPATPSLALPEDGALTWSAWIKPAANAANAGLFSRYDGDKGFTIGLDNGVPYVEVSSTAGVQRTPGGAPVPLNSWHHLAVTANHGAITLFLDGTVYGTLTAHLPALTSTASLGGAAVPSTAMAAPAGEQTPTVSSAVAPSSVNGASSSLPAGASPAPTGTTANDSSSNSTAASPQPQTAPAAAEPSATSAPPAAGSGASP